MPYFPGDQRCCIAIYFLLERSEAQKNQELNKIYKAQKAPEIYKIQMSGVMSSAPPTHTPQNYTSSNNC